ncbi:hypothetical protein LDENG_00086570 [Lucifuga dentata]|nr:hypothetical protein LDENG_00086570 [Lucifuga dentata]
MAIIECVITSSITVWFGSAASQSKHILQRIVCCAEQFIGCPLPSITNLHSARSTKESKVDHGQPLPPWTHSFSISPL